MKNVYGIGGSSLCHLPEIRNYKTKRISSYDRCGGNKDYIIIPVGETKTIASIEGAGCIKHLWFGGGCYPYGVDEEKWLRKTILKIYWDREELPSVDSPLGDFFGVGHGQSGNYISLPMSMITADYPERPAMNCWFPMPFYQSARIELLNACEKTDLQTYFYVDYDLDVDFQGDERFGRFHAQWREESPCRAVSYEKTIPDEEQSNLSGRENYVILDAKGKGHYVGCNLSVRALSPGWWGEGDDMIFIDHEEWPPSFHGTGTEDYFCYSYEFPVQGWFGPYFGVSLPGSSQIRDWSNMVGKTNCWTVYRFHIEDPIVFQKSIRVTIEHGHANNRGDEYASVAYWYQLEPHKEFNQKP